MGKTLAPGMKNEKEMDGLPPQIALEPAAARWELDTAQLRPVINAFAAGEAPPGDWTEIILAGARVAEVNRQVERLIGPHFGQVDMLGRPVGTFWPAESRTDLAELILEVAAGGSEATRTRRISSLMLADPELTVWRTQAHGPDRLCVEVVGSAGDERSSWALRASEERYRKLIHHLPLALLQVDAREVGESFTRLRAQGVSKLGAWLDLHPQLVGEAAETVRITEVNDSAARLFGTKDVADLIGPLSWLFSLSPETPRRLMIAHFEGQRSHSETMKLRTVDGRILDVRLSATFPTPPEQLDVTLIGLEDLTDSIRTETQLRHLEAEFGRAARISTLGELTTSIAHEVNQPLAAILTNAETSLRWLSRDEPDLAKIGQLTSRIATSARRASEIVQRIRRMAAKPSLDSSPVDLNEVVEEALLFVRHDLHSRSIDLSVELGRRLPSVLGDRVHLQQVIVNLMVNGIQAIAHSDAAKGRIALTTGTDERGDVILVVRDDGPGIDEEHLDRIFDGFFTTKEDGIGIGLAICQSILVAHGGGIAASNLPDGGACFRLWLPAAGSPS